MIEMNATITTNNPEEEGGPDAGSINDQEVPVDSDEECVPFVKSSDNEGNQRVSEGIVKKSSLAFFTRPGRACILIALTFVVFSLVLSIQRKDQSISKTSLHHKNLTDSTPVVARTPLLTVEPTPQPTLLSTAPPSLNPAESPSVKSVNDMVLPTPKFNSSCIPTALTSYPGSGSTITRMLVELATGVWTGSIYGDASLFKAQPYAFKGEMSTTNVVAVKTHGPWHQQPTFPPAQRAVVMVRNPFSAIPSYYNWLYGFHHKINEQHQIQAPKADWEAWRGSNVGIEITHWCTHFAYWMDRFHVNPNYLFVGTFEDLVDKEKGPETLNEIVDFLGFSNPQVSDIWKKVIADTSEGIHRHKSYKPEYTEDLKNVVLSKLMELRNRYGSNKDILSILDKYIEIGRSSQRGLQVETDESAAYLDLDFTRLV